MSTKDPSFGLVDPGIKGSRKIGPLSGDPDILSAMLEAGKIGCWQMEITSFKILGCNIFSAFFGSDSEDRTCISLLRAVDEQSRRILTDILRSVFGQKHFSVEVKFLAIQGQRPKWAKISGSIQISQDGKLEYLAGIIEDISVAKRIEQDNLDTIAFLNHELRTPLTAMRLFVQSALKSLGKESENTNKLLQKADLQISEMHALTEEYLNQSPFDNGGLSLHIDRYDLVASLKQITEKYAELYTNFNFILQLPLELHVLADRAKITQVVTNLLDNSIKYSAIGSTISIWVLKQSKNVMVAIADQGAGIGREDLSRLFERFFRSAEAYAGKRKGYGIGLHLVKRIISAHSGMIAATSCLSHGSEFYFTLPFSESTLQA